jgi:hypothetical protein
MTVSILPYRVFNVLSASPSRMSNFGWTPAFTMSPYSAMRKKYPERRASVRSISVPMMCFCTCSRIAVDDRPLAASLARIRIAIGTRYAAPPHAGSMNVCFVRFAPLLSRSSTSRIESSGCVKNIAYLSRSLRLSQSEYAEVSQNAPLSRSPSANHVAKACSLRCLESLLSGRSELRERRG